MLVRSVHLTLGVGLLFGCDWFVLVLVVELCCLFVALGCLGVVVVSDRCFMLWLVDFLVVCIVFAFGLLLDGWVVIVGCCLVGWLVVFLHLLC